MVITDPKAEILRKTGNLLKQKGYEVIVFDLINPSASFCYNPFVYVHDDREVLTLIENLIQNTTPSHSKSSDPFWEKSETALLQALMLYLLHEAPPEEQNFPMVMEMIAAAEVHEDDDNYQSPLDIAYDIRELGEQLMPLGMLVTLDAIYNRVIQNWKKGRRTWIFCDEFYILFRYEYSANFFYKLWKRIRKYNGLVTGLTQNVDELLRSDTARLMLANSEFLVMLNQSATDRAELAKLLNISDNQLGYVTNVPAGCGLIRCAGNIVPFTNSFPRNTKLYKLMSTNPSEKKE